ncbi:MAG: chorismate mutase [Alphaproteobacteria bacterium]
MTNQPTSLDALRREIDRLDDALHDLIVKRAEIVAGIRAAKAGSLALRPAREAEVLRRLLARHTGDFPRASLVRVWREIMGAMVRLQGPFSVAALADGACAALAREEYGASTAVAEWPRARDVLAAMRQGAASIAVLPVPHPSEVDPWWPKLLDDGEFHIVAGLPFASHPGAGTGAPKALAVARLAPAPSGEDRTWIGVRGARAADAERLRVVFGNSGIAVRAAVMAKDGAAFEVEGFIESSDARLSGIAAAVPGATARVLGAYAVPLDDARLAG